MTSNEIRIDRRTAVVGAGAIAAAAALAGCSTYGNDSGAAAEVAPPADGPAGALAKTSDVPVGGGVIVGDTVITQPTAGTFVGLSATCTHAGCKVAKIADGTINCPCHGSRFGLDGSVSSGPAARPLPPKPVRVEGDSIVQG
ncbi:Rieske (2Fe-2S) protein [Nocardia rhizosphaerae]|uniref:Cytochrome bc1 complex Rieske iron-sulfur subunit n=1 Tax=Nocardia rhizosphaerae TaxID=1691571 RepID=A0ABV8KZA9_9NOCA